MVSKEKWVEVIKDFYETDLPESVKREIDIPLKNPINRAVSIIGPRRSGKTFLMFNLIKELLLKVDKENILYVNFERAGLLPLESKDLVLLKEVFFDLNPNMKKQNVWFFFDEIQNVNSWEIFIRECLDEGINVFISGSSSRMLSKDIATSMRGRTLSYFVFPFSFIEYLESKNVSNFDKLSSSEKSKIVNCFQEYFISGGYPETIFYPENKNKILTNIFETALYRDVIDREKIRNTKVILSLVKALISAKEFSINKFYNYLKSLNVKVSKNSLYNYASYLEDAFVVFFLKKFSPSYKKSEQSLPKVYFIDNGILTTNGIDDRGRLLENIVFIELMRRGLEVAYSQNSSGEIDFLIKEGKKVRQLIQVCYSLDDIITFEREIKSLVNASKELNCNSLLVLTNSKESEIVREGRKIKLVPVWRWLLEKK